MTVLLVAPGAFAQGFDPAAVKGGVSQMQMAAHNYLSQNGYANFDVSSLTVDQIIRLLDLQGKSTTDRTQITSVLLSGPASCGGRFELAKATGDADMTLQNMHNMLSKYGFADFDVSWLRIDQVSQLAALEEENPHDIKEKIAAVLASAEGACQMRFDRARQAGEVAMLEAEVQSILDAYGYKNQKAADLSISQIVEILGVENGARPTPPNPAVKQKIDSILGG